MVLDADSVLDPTALRRAVCYLQQRQLQHLTALPEMRMPGVLLGIFTSAFGIFFSLYARTWKAKDPGSKRSIGIGAFILTHGTTQVLNVLIVSVLLGITADSNRFHDLSPWYAPGLPLGGLLFTYIVWRAMLTTLWNGGIRWRGTYYPLRLNSKPIKSSRFALACDFLV